MNNKITIICKTSEGQEIQTKINPDETIKKLIEKIKKYIENCKFLDLYFDNKKLDPSLKICQTGLKNNSIVESKNEIKVIEEGLNLKEIDIQFFYDDQMNIPTTNSNIELTSLLKLCLLKEISQVINQSILVDLKDETKIILEILKKGYINPLEDMKNNIKNILEKINGSNIINFSRYVDNCVKSDEISLIMSKLQKKDFIRINDIKNRLSKYQENIKLFDKNFALAMKKSIFEFSVVSIALVDMNNFQTYYQERQKCPNKEEKILFHGTGIGAISSILTSEFRKSIDKHYQHGKGVYFTEDIDYAWFYGGVDGNRSNKNIIPNLTGNNHFTMIACSVYYDKNHFNYVENSKYTPKKNEINFALARSDFSTIKEKDLDKSKFYGTEYVIYELSQICPFLAINLKKAEYCFIWRDNNFSKKPVFNSKWDQTFKSFLAQRIKFIEEYAEFNIYTCETSEEALALVERKKYNKIILISNIGPDEAGRIFVENARKIIGNNTIALFLTYSVGKHIKKINLYKNALISNDENIYEKFLQCFTGYGVKEKINDLKEYLEDSYNVNFNFDDNFLEYPNYREKGFYSDLKFNNEI